MKHLKTFFACMLMAVFSIGQMWGADPDVTYDFTGSDWSVSDGALTNGTVSFTGAGDANFKMNTGYFIMGKSGAYITFPAYSSAVEKIVVTGRSGASGSAKQNIFVGETAVSTETTGATGSNTYEIASASQAAGTIYTLKVTSNHNTQITKIEIFYAASGDPSEDPGDDPTPSSDVYELVTSANELAEGDEIIIVNTANSKALSTTQNSNNRGQADVTISNDAITPGDDVQILTLGITNSHWTLYTGSGYLYAASSSSNQLKTQATNNANGEWTISISDGVATLTAQGSNTRNVMQYNASSALFACYASASQAALAIFKKSDGSTPQKQNAGLSYAEADQKKLVKLGEAFTAPTLSNPNNLSGITYAINNTTVAEVAANGAVTIKAAGVAVITASFAGNDDYKEGSASYTIGVTTHAGTSADPYVAADAKIAIDVKGTVENAYATGIVSNITTTTLPQEGYITFYFSADGLTTSQQIEAYKCYGLNSAAFEAVTDVKTGATVVVTGTLKKYNSTYEFDQNCHLVSYEAPAVPKTHIANTKETAYTVAQALVYAADGVTYDLDDYVYVRGVVYDVKSFNEGVMNIFIKDANAENSFELFKCAGINDGSATTPFEALSDVQVGNIVIGYGQLTVYNNVSEFKQGNYIVDFQKPVTGVELDATAEVEVGSKVNLTATIKPSNATGTIVWSVTEGSSYASVADGEVTGIAAGEATIRATVQGTEIYAECSVTITEASTPVSYDYALVTDAAQLQDGLKVIIVAATADKAAGSAAATYRSVVDVERTTNGNYLILDSENMPTEFTLGVSGDKFTFNDGDGYMYESAAKSVKVQDEAFDWTITIGEGNIATIQATNELRYNSGSPRFTTYASGQQALQLYVKDDGKQPAGLAWSTDVVELTVGDEFIAPTLTNTHELTVTIVSNNTELATVTAGVVSLVENATGTATITASFEGDDTYRAASVSYTITVNSAEPPTPATYDYALVTDAAQLQDGLKVIIVAANEDKAAGSAAATYRNVVDVERTTDGNYLILDSENMPTEFTIGVSGNNFTFNDGDGYMYESAAKSVKVQDEAFDWTITIGEGNVATIQATNELRYNSGSPRFTTYASGQQALQLYVKDDGKQAAGLAWSTNAVELTTDETFTAPTLANPNNLTVSIESNNTELAIVTDGVVSLVEDATGTATITATFAGNDTYRAASVSYTIKVNPAHSIYVDKLTVNFNSVEKDATIDNKTITVTLTNVDAVTATLAGDGASAFSITPAALTASGDITISASTANVGTFSATITISDNDNQAVEKVVNLSITVNEPEAPESAVSTTSEWIPATDADLINGKEVLITGVKDEVIYAMGTQKSNNREAVAGTINGDVFTPGEGTMAFTLVAQSDGTYAFRASNGKYLYAAGSGSGKNYLRAQAEIDGNAKWTLSIASAIANGENTNKTMQFNGGNSKLFSCYSSASQEAIALYVQKQADPEPEPDYRTVTPNRYGTICIPEGGRMVEGILFEISYRNDVEHKIYFDEIVGGTMVAGRPYIYWSNSSQIGIIYDGKTAQDPGSYHGLIGSFEGGAITANEGNYILYANKIYEVDRDGASVGANKAYISMSAVPTEPQQAPGRRRVSLQIEGEQVATDILNAELNAQPMKVVIDNQLFIIREGKMYDMTGRLVK